MIKFTKLIYTTLIAVAVYLLATEFVFKINSIPVQAVPLQPSPSVAQTAKATTVRLVGEVVSGSGVIVARQGQTYIVVTCAHVVDADTGEGFKVLTSDGQSHSAQKDNYFQFGDLDLAVVKFSSRNNYKYVALGQYQNLTAGDRIYIAGYPNFQYRLGVWEESYNSGLQSYQFAAGQVSLLLAQPLENGYQLGITNDVINGMSGGPVLNAQGKLVGIIGRIKYAPGGIETYHFADGTVPSKKLFEQIESASWTIPVTNFSQVPKAFPRQGK
jgi:serine protease Do